MRGNTVMSDCQKSGCPAGIVNTFGNRGTNVAGAVFKSGKVNNWCRFCRHSSTVGGTVEGGIGPFLMLDRRR